jgi:transcriptional regulator with XRE-family HTH domain
LKTTYTSMSTFSFENHEDISDMPPEEHQASPFKHPGEISMVSDTKNDHTGSSEHLFADALENNTVDMAVSDYFEQKIDTNELARKMKPHCDRVALSVANRRRVRERYLIEDFSQYLQILCVTNLLDRYDSSRGTFLNYLYSTALFESGAFFMKNRLGVNTAGDKISYMVRDTNFANRVLSQDMVEEAKNTFTRLLQRDDSINQATKRAKRRSNNLVKTVSNDHEQIKEIRKKLCLTQREFAEMLHIDYERLRSYEYGRASTPAHILKAAQDLALSYASSDDEPDTTWTTDESMAEILERWATQLGLHGSSYANIAETLGVSRMTISRWKNNQTRPGIRTLLEIQRYVDSLQRKLVAG